MKISAVATHVGYNSASYFNYIFKKIYGAAPQEFLRSLRPGTSCEDPDAET